MKKSLLLFLSLLMIGAVSIFFFSPAPKAYALKYGPFVKPVKPAKKKIIKIKEPLLTPASYHGFFNNKVIKVVLQVSSPNPKRWKIALLNMNDIIWELHYNSKRYKAVFVAYGPAVRMFLKKNNKLTSLIEKLYKHKVKFDSCHVAMIKLRISPDAILPIVHITPDGFFAILHYEMMGYSYIKP